MEKRTLGKTGIKVSELGFGGLSCINQNVSQTKKLLIKELDFGVNYIDTAPGYGESEKILGEILEEIDLPLILSTKLGYKPEPFNPKDKDCLLRSVDNSLKKLKRDYIDILFIHEPDRPGQFDWWTDHTNYYGPVIEVLETLKYKNIIKHTGIAGTTAYELSNIIKTGAFDVVLTAFNYSLLWREAEISIIPEAKKHNMGIIVGSPLQQGALSKRYDKEIEKANWISPPRRLQYKALYNFLDDMNISLSELSIRFILSNPFISCLLISVASEKEVELNIASAEKGPLSEEIIKRLNEIASMVPFRPCEEPFILPFNREYFGPGPLR